MIVISSGLWISQAPGAESVGGVCLLLRPGPSLWRPGPSAGSVPVPATLPEGYTVDLLAVLEHPVDTRPRSMTSATGLALSELPQPAHLSVSLDIERARAPEDWMWRPGPPTPFVAPLDLWSRVRRWHPSWRVGPDARFTQRDFSSEVTLRWKSGADTPEVQGASEGRDYELAWAQAALVCAAVHDLGR